MSGSFVFLFSATVENSPAAADGSFAPTPQFENLEIHTVFRRLSNFDLEQNLSPSALADFSPAAVRKQVSSSKKGVIST